VTTDDQQPIDNTGTGDELTIDVPPRDPADASPGSEPAFDAAEPVDEPTGDPDAADDKLPDVRVLPIAVQTRLLREQFEDPDWRRRPTRLVIERTVPEDPIGWPVLGVAFPDRRRNPGALHRAWRHAQEALDGTRLGSTLRPVVELVPGDGRFHVALGIPELGASSLLGGRGTRTPLGVMRRAERSFVRMLIRENARLLAARQAAVDPEAAPAPTTAEAPGDADTATPGDAGTTGRAPA